MFRIALPTLLARFFAALLPPKEPEVVLARTNWRTAILEEL